MAQGRLRPSRSCAVTHSSATTAAPSETSPHRTVAATISASLFTLLVRGQVGLQAEIRAGPYRARRPGLAGLYRRLRLPAAARLRCHLRITGTLLSATMHGLIIAALSAPEVVGHRVRARPFGAVYEQD